MVNPLITGVITHLLKIPLPFSRQDIVSPVICTAKPSAARKTWARDARRVACKRRERMKLGRTWEALELGKCWEISSFTMVYQYEWRHMDTVDWWLFWWLIMVYQYFEDSFVWMIITRKMTNCIYSSVNNQTDSLKTNMASPRKTRSYKRCIFLVEWLDSNGFMV